MRARGSWFVSLLAITIWGAASASEADAHGTVAVWQAQEFEFRHHGGSTLYSCGGLRERVRVILLRLGARADVNVSVFDCGIPYLPARVRIKLNSPRPADPDTVRSLTTYDARDELIARAQGVNLPGPADLERFPAAWETISFVRDASMGLSPGDCELVRQIRREIIPRLAVRIERDNIRCSAVFGNISRPRLTVDALVAAQ